MSLLSRRILSRASGVRFCQVPRLYSSVTPTDAEFEKMVQKISDNPRGLAAHVMQSVGPDTNLEGCPFLSQNPILGRTADRESNARTYARRFPIAIKSAKGSVVTDTTGKEYLDALGVAGTLSLGHNHPAIVQGIRDFLDAGHPMQTLDVSSPIKDAFVSQLFDILPKDFQKDARIQFCGPAGTDVTEAALKLSQYYTGRSSTIAFHGAYHGHTIGALALMGNLGPKSELRNMPGGVQFAPYPYAYRCPFGLGGDEGTRVINMYLERMLDDVESGVVHPSAIILEPIQGEGGVIPAPPEFLQRIRKITEERDIVLIMDEIQTGFFRSGRTFAHEYAGIVPDILCLSKAVGGGLPLGVIVYNKKFDKWGPGAHAGTFRGNQLAMETGRIAMKWSVENNLAAESERKGKMLMDELKKLQSKTKTIGDVRGLGLMIGVEMVNPDGTPDHLGSLPHSPEIATEIQVRCLQKGMIIEKGGRHGCVIRFLCPLTTTDEQIQQVAETFSAAVLETARGK